MTLARRHDITRLEGFSDAVFGVALTPLVVSLDVRARRGVRGAKPLG
jgi:uncharacterized membrane protein